MQITGLLSEITKLESITSASGIISQVQSLIVQNEEYHNQPICFPITGSKAGNFSALIGRKVTLDFEIVSLFSNGQWSSNFRVFAIFAKNNFNEIIAKHHFGKRPEEIL